MQCNAMYGHLHLHLHLHCVVLYCTAFAFAFAFAFCSVVYCIALHCIALQCFVLRRSAMLWYGMTLLSFSVVCIPSKQLFLDGQLFEA